MQIIIKPLISEKTIKLVDQFNKYSFVVAKESNKIQIADAIRKKFDVKVKSVRTKNYLGKPVRFGKERIPGSRKNFKQAIVTLEDGDKIELFNIS